MNIFQFEKLTGRFSLSQPIALLSTSFGTVARFAIGERDSTQSGLRNNFKKFNNPTYIIGAIAVILFVLVLFLLARQQSSTVLQYDDQRAEAPLAKAKQVLNKTFYFPLKDAKGTEISKIVYTIQDAQLQDEIIVKGQRARAVKGRTFLVLNVKIKNDHKQTIEISSRDYVRLSLNDSKELLAADIHNDPVQVQAISTKYTRIAFPINDSDKNLILHIGEISGKKEELELNFNK